MRRTSIIISVLSMMFVVFTSVNARPSSPTCDVQPSIAKVGDSIIVTIRDVTKKEARYGWFAVYDVGPTTRQAATNLSPVPYGDNGSGVLSGSADGTWTFLFWVQPDPGMHRVMASYRRVFATCWYEAVP